MQKATNMLTAVAVVFAAIQAWDILDRRGILSNAIAVGLFLVCLVLMLYAAYRNLSDAARGKALRAEIVTIKDEHKTQLEHREQQAAKAIEDIRYAYQAASDERAKAWQQARDFELKFRDAQAAVAASDKELNSQRSIIEMLGADQREDREEIQLLKASSKVAPIVKTIFQAQ